MAKQRYDVYIERNVQGDDASLALIRFPAMKSQFENNPENIQLSIKPKSFRTRLEVSLDTDSPNFCQDHAQLLASRSIPKTFPGGLVNKNFYSSTKIPIEDGQLFVAKVVNDKLVCRPLSNIITMRHDFSHFDPKEEVDPKEEIRPISVKFAAPDRQNVPSRNQDNLVEPDDPLDEYCLLDYKSLESNSSELDRIALFGEQLPKIKKDPDEEMVDVKPSIDLKPDIKPKLEKIRVEDIYSTTSQQQASSQINSPKKANQIKNWVKECLMKAKLVSFEEVHNFIRMNQNNSKDQMQLSNKDILDALDGSALLVQGNWAVKSELLYDPKERDCTDVTGISISLFVSARDYLLWLFTQNRFVSRMEFSQTVRMPDHDVLELFNQLATFRNNIRRWELKLPTDTKFLDQFPDVAQRQTTCWKVRRANKFNSFSPQTN